MAIEFDCPHCGRHYRVADAAGGKRTKCKQCQNVITVPKAPPKEVDFLSSNPGEFGDAPVDATVALNAKDFAVSAQAHAAAQEQEQEQGYEPQAPAARGPGRPMQGRPMPGQPMPAGPMPGGPMPMYLPANTPLGPRALNFVFLIGALLLLIGFFTPWVDVVIVKFSAFDLAVVPFRAPKSAPGSIMVLLFLFLIPISNLAAGIEEFIAAPKGQNRWWLRLIAALSIPISFLLITLTMAALIGPGPGGGGSSPRGGGASSDGPSIFSLLGIGFYLSGLGFIVAMVGVFTSPKPKGPGGTPGQMPMRPQMGAPWPPMPQQPMQQQPMAPVPRPPMGRPRLPGRR